MSITVLIDTYISHGDAYIYHDEHGNTVWTNKYKVIYSVEEHSYGILVTTTKDHGFSVGDEVTLVETVHYNDIPSEILSVESARSFTVGLSYSSGDETESGYIREDEDYIGDEDSGYVGKSSDIKDIEIALRKATEWIDNHPNYKGNWKGAIVTQTQLLSHPRTGLYDEENRVYNSTVVADKIKYACAIMANKIIENFEDIFPDINVTDMGLKRKKIDVIEKEWFAPKESNMRKKYDKVDQLLSSFVIGYGNLKTLVRGY